MSTGYCGILWQNMPPRSQRTRQQRILQRPAWDPSSPDCLTPPTTTAYFQEFKTASMDARAHRSYMRPRLQRQKESFPERTSVYIRNLKHQKRVNSARNRIIDDPSIVSYPPLMRTHTAPQLSGTTLLHLESLDKSQTEEVQKTLRRSIPVKTVAPFLETDAEETTKDRTKQYVVNSTDNAVMYIDNDKILYFRNKKSDLPQICKTKDDYIAHLRKQFINQVTCARRENRTPTVVKERLDYDKRVSHILDYYEKGDESCNKKCSEMCQQRGDRCQSTRVGARSQTPKSPPPSRRLRSSDSARLRSLLSGPPSSGQTRAAFPDTAEECQIYLKVNVQSVLHDREYPWQTTGDHGGVKPSDVIACECKMCRLEMGLLLSARMRRSVCVEKEYGDASEVLNDSSHVSFADGPGQLGEVDEYLSGDGSSVNASFDREESESKEKSTIKKNEMINGKKKAERHNDTEAELQNGYKDHTDRHEESFSDERTEKDADYLSVTFPSVLQINHGDSSVRVPDNSPTPGDRPYEDEE